MPWKKDTTGKPQWTPGQAERVSAQSDAGNPSVTRIVTENVSAKYETKKDTGRRAASAGPPAAKYSDILSMILIGLTTIFAWLLVNDRPHTDDDIQELTMRDDETEIIVKPLSRVIANSFIGRKYGEKIIGAEDYVALIFVSFMYVRRTWPFVVARLDRMRTKNRSNERTNEPRNNGRNGTPQYQGTARPYSEQQGVFINPAVSDT